MHPYNHHPYNYHLHSGPWFRGPPRFLYFLLGAGVATWWQYAKHRHCDRHVAYGPTTDGFQSSSVNNSHPWSRAWERRHITQEEFSRQAADTMDATLDSVVRTVESMKAKLAEHRAELDKYQQTPRTPEASNPPQ